MRTFRIYLNAYRYSANVAKRERICVRAAKNTPDANQHQQARNAKFARCEFSFNPLTAGAAYIRVLIFLLAHKVPHFKYVKDKINQQDLRRIDLHFVKSE